MRGMEMSNDNSKLCESCIYNDTCDHDVESHIAKYSGMGGDSLLEMFGTIDKWPKCSYTK